MPPGKQNNNNLTSWKQIADFLRVSERTAQTWEREKGLPVKRLTGSKGRVSADIVDLELWMKANIKPAPWYASLVFLRYYAAISIGLLLLAVGTLVGIRLAANSLGEPADCRLDYKTLIVTDLSGRELWRYAFPDPFQLGSYDQDDENRKKAWFGELNPGDREVSTIFAYYPVTADSTGGELFCFSQKGKVKWRFKTTRIVSDLQGTYQTPYVIAGYHVLPIEEGGPNRIFVTSHNTYGAPNQFVILDGGGNVLGEYWQAGSCQ